MLFLLAAHAATCTSSQAVGSYKPRAGGVDGVGAGWPKHEVKAMPFGQQERWKDHKSVAKRYPADRQQELMDGVVRTPIEEVGVYLAWGAPDYAWKVGGGCRALLYATEHDRLFETCGGNITAEYELEAPLDCERLDVVVPRVEKRKGRFRDLTREQQLELLVGTPGTWMDKHDVELAFGEPFKKKGDVWRYHDDSGVVEGPVVTYADGQVASVVWPSNPTVTRKGRRIQRKEAAEQRRAELEAYRREAAAERRRTLLKAVAVTAVVAAAVAVADELEPSSPPPAPSPRPSPSPSSSTSTDGRSTTTTSHSSTNGIPVTHTQTVVDDTPRLEDGRYTFKPTCSMPFTASIAITVSGGRFTAKSVVDLITASDPPFEPEHATLSGAVTHRGDVVTLEGLGSGQVYHNGYVKLRTSAWPHAACANKEGIWQ